MFLFNLVFFPVTSESGTLGFSGNPARGVEAHPACLHQTLSGRQQFLAKLPTAPCRRKVFLFWLEL